jgi:hypothetical protein
VKEVLPADANDLMWDKANLHPGEDIFRTDVRRGVNGNGELHVKMVSCTHSFRPKYFMPSLTCMSSARLSIDLETNSANLSRYQEDNVNFH